MPTSAFILQSVNINLRRVNEVHLKQTGLQMSLGGPVVLQGIQQEGGALLDQVALHEHVHDLRRSRKEEVQDQDFKWPDEEPFGVKYYHFTMKLKNNIGSNNRLKGLSEDRNDGSKNQRGGSTVVI